MSGSLLSVLSDNPEGLTGLVELDGALAASCEDEMSTAGCRLSWTSRDRQCWAGEDM